VKCLIFMADPTGFEPVASAFGGLSQYARSRLIHVIYRVSFTFERDWIVCNRYA
jgi:hypothetical protein